MDFKVGDKVSHVPIDRTKGVIISIDDHDLYPIRVRWKEDMTGIYREDELELIEEEPKEDYPQAEIDQVMDWMDFGRILAVIQALDWSWYDIGIPQYEGDVREKCRKLIHETVTKAIEKGDTHSLKTGGFAITYDPSVKFLEVDFLITGWSTGQ